MASTYTDNLGIEKPGSGEQSGTWGTTTNTNFDIIDRAINGVLDLSLTGTTTTLTTSDGSLSDGGYKVLVLGGSPSGENTITISPNDQDKVYLVKNSSGQSAVFTQGSGGNATLIDGETAWIFADGAGSGAQVQKASFIAEIADDTSPQLGGVLDTNGNNVELPDSSGAEVNRLKFGAGDDLAIYHDGSDSYIQDTGTGDLNIQGNNIVFKTGGGGQTYADFNLDGAVELYHDNTKRIETTSSGVDVTGAVQASQFTLDTGSNDLTIIVASNKLRFLYGGNNKMELDTSGNLKVTGDVTAFGSI